MNKVSFNIVKKDKHTWARAGIVHTPHGVIHTPYFFPVATKATVRTLDPNDLKEIGVEAVLANTYHLHLQPGEKIIEKIGGLHQFMGWSDPLVTDSGGFQVFSLGFGRDQGVGKILKIFPQDSPEQKKKQPQYLKITERGVEFRSPYNGDKLFLSPEVSIAIQEKLGADLIFAFDECTSPLADYVYTKRSLQRTHRWEERSLRAHRRQDQALFGIIQGGRWKDLRKESARFIERLPFGGIGIGGSLGRSKRDMFKILDWVIPELKQVRPRHLLGIGWRKDIVESIARGIDLFDCVEPTRLARHGIALTRKRRMNLTLAKYSKDSKPIEKNCSCYACQNFSRAYLRHLFKAREMLGFRLLTIHNLTVMEEFMDGLRRAILEDKFDKSWKEWKKVKKL